MLQVHGLQGHSFASGLFSGLMALPMPDPSTYNSAVDMVEALLRRLQTGLSRWVDLTEGNFYLSFTPLDEIIFAVPDIVLQLAKQKLLTMLARNPLFQHAKIASSSLSTVWYFLNEHPSILGDPAVTSPSVPRLVRYLVVQVGETLCEVTRYHIIHESEATIVRQSGTTHSELCG